MWSLKPEEWGSPLVQEKYQEEKACDKKYDDDDDDDDNNNNNKLLEETKYQIFGLSNLQQHTGI